MKKIEFYELSLIRNPLAGLAILVAAFFPLLSLFDVFDFLGEQNVKLITAICYCIIAYQVGLRQFFYRNHVQWNKRGMNIRINEFWGKSIRFDEVTGVFYEEDEYTIASHLGKRTVINLTGIDSDSKSKLMAILQEHVR